MDNPASALVYYLVFLFSTTVHEAAHAWVAKLGGDLTAYHGGQVSLDPRPHIKREPFGMVVLPLISCLISGWPFGFASAPYDPQWALRHPRRAAWMALAGPASNLLIAFLALVAIRIGVAAGMFVAPDSVTFDHVVAAADGASTHGAAFMLSVFFSLNVVLAALNLIPFPPLDGSGVIMLGLSEQAASKYQLFLWNNAGLRVFGMLGAWYAFGVIYHPLFLAAVNLIYPHARYG
jgi:Zn-dependent protease